MLKQFITTLGGSELVAVQLSEMAQEPLSKRAVYQWPYDGTIPHRWRYYVAKLAKKKKIKDVPPEIAGYMQ